MLQAFAATWLALATPAETSPGEAAASVGKGKFMDCNGARLCGVLALETGFGKGYYHHDKPGVHGLWPQVKPYGSSDCVKPSGSRTDPSVVFPCYVDTHAGADHQLSFEKHEWEKHGECAGAANATDYFDQICALSASPVGVMAEAREQGATDLADFVSALSAAGYPVWASEPNGDQVQLSVCAASDGRWKIASAEQFGIACGGARPSGSAAPAPLHGS